MHMVTYQLIAYDEDSLEVLMSFRLKIVLLDDFFSFNTFSNDDGLTIFQGPRENQSRRVCKFNMPYRGWNVRLATLSVTAFPRRLCLTRSKNHTN